MNLNNRETSLYIIIGLALVLLWCMCGRTSSYMHLVDDDHSNVHSNTHSNVHSNVHSNLETMGLGTPTPTPPSQKAFTPDMQSQGTGDIVGMSPDDAAYASVDYTGTPITHEVGCAVNSGVGLSSSLLPRAVGTAEQFGEFAPDDILKGQNFLNVRNQIGFPETLGGNIRNGNQQLRAEIPNPKQPYVWNNSTIVPDMMQKPLCT